MPININWIFVTLFQTITYIEVYDRWMRFNDGYNLNKLDTLLTKFQRPLKYIQTIVSDACMV